jgi:triacylglycerol lipase
MKGERDMTISPTHFPFKSDATTYSLNNAYWLARAASIAYLEKSAIQPAVANLGLESFEFLNKNDTEGFIAANGKIIVVAFRGTEPMHLQDILADARMHKVPGPLGEVHRGFLQAFELVKDDMFGA